MAGPTKLVDAKEALQVIDFGLLSIRQTTQGIRKALGKEVRRDQQATQKKQGFLRRLFDNARKKDAEKLVEAQKPKSFLSTASANIMGAGENFLERVLKAAGIFLVGYLVAKLPIIIKKIEEVVEWIKSVAGFIKPFVDGVVGISRTIASTVGEWITGIKKNNDWTKDGDAVESKMKELNESVETLNKDWITLQDKIKQDIEKAEKDGRASVEGLDQETQDTVEATDNRSSQIIDLQEKRDSGELSDEQYIIEVNKIYEQRVDNDTDQMSNFSTDKEQPIVGSGLSTQEKIAALEVQLKDMPIGSQPWLTGERRGIVNQIKELKAEQELTLKKTNTTGSSTNENVVVNNNKDDSKVVTREMTKEDWVAYRNKRAKRYNNSSNVGVKVKLINMINTANSRLGLPHIEPPPNKSKEFLAHKVPLITNDLKIDGILKSDANLKSVTGKTIEIPIDTNEVAINNGSKTTVVNNGSDGNGGTVVISQNPISQLSKFNRHFT